MVGAGLVAVRSLSFIGEIKQDGTYDPKMDHLVCFLPGLLALGAANGARPQGVPLLQHPDMRLAEELMYTCYMGYREMAAELAPEIWRFRYRDARYEPCPAT